MKRTTLTAATLSCLSGLALAAPAPAASTGPSTATRPYVLPAADGVSITSLLTVGDRVGGYRMAGIPDGLGARRGEGGLEVLVNHELRDTQGTVRAHGQRGSFVGRYAVDPATRRVTAGADLARTVQHWRYSDGAYGPTPQGPAGATSGHTAAWNRFCSSSLTGPGQLLNRTTGRGYDGQLYFGNEENGDEGRIFGITTDGVAWQLPRLGLAGWENHTLAASTSDTTLVLGNEDSGDGQLRAYWGTKSQTGSPVDRAGLTNGVNHVLRAGAVRTDADFRSTYGKGVAAPVDFAPLDWNTNGRAQNAAARDAGLTLNRIEDGAFDPRNPEDYYFLTTEGGDRTPAEAGVPRDGGGLWRLSFTDVDRPWLGGTLTLLLDGSEAPYLNKPDNVTVDAHGNVLIQEDPGGNAHLARVLAYRIADGARGVVAQFDPALFTPGAFGFLTQDEESSGILDVSDLVGKKGTFVLTAQVHAPEADPELVEKGQLLLLTVQSWGQVYRPEA